MDLQMYNIYEGRDLKMMQKGSRDLTVEKGIDSDEIYAAKTITKRAKFPHQKGISYAP